MTWILFASIPPSTSTFFTPSEIAMIASTFLVYFLRDNTFFFKGKSTRVEITFIGTFAREAAADPTATEWASWKLTSLHFFLFIARESRRMDRAFASLDIFSGRTGSPASDAFCWRGLPGWTTNWKEYPLRFNSSAKKKDCRCPPFHSLPASIRKRLNSFSYFPDLLELGIDDKTRVSVQQRNDKSRKSIQKTCL